MIFKSYMLRLPSNFLEKSCQSWDYAYDFGSKLSSEEVYLEEVIKLNFP